MVTCQFGGEFPDALSPIPVGIREARHRETFPTVTYCYATKPTDPGTLTSERIAWMQKYRMLLCQDGSMVATLFAGGEWDAVFRAHPF
jgi:hypothetical protein